MAQRIKGKFSRYTDAKDSTKWWVVDCEPQLISTITALCPQAKQVSAKQVEMVGKHITRPYLLSDTMKSAVSLDWVLYKHRKVIEVSEEDLAYISKLREKDERRMEQTSGFEAAIQNGVFEPPVLFTGELRDYQSVFVKMAEMTRRILLADDLGLGKSVEAIAASMFDDSGPVLVVCPGHLCPQWRDKINEFTFMASTEILEGYKPRQLRDGIDYCITSYDRILHWEKTLVSYGFRTVIFDEVHELRHFETQKRRTAALLSESAEYCYGLSATPIFNMGGEIWSVMDVIAPGCLGAFSEFQLEWCISGKHVTNPADLGRYLRDEGLMLRRTAAEAGIQNGDMVSDVVTVEASIEELKKIEDVAKVLAQKTLLGNFAESGEASRQFDIKLRQATGVAKARAVCEFVKQLLEGGAPTVLLATHHHDVNAIISKELAKYYPVFYNGRATTHAKGVALDMFKRNKQTGCRVLVMHLRSGQGVDGLEQVCNHIVYGELDWSPAAHSQFAGRLAPWRNNLLIHSGVRSVVYAYYVVINDGSDPSMIDFLGVKKAQREGLVDLKATDAFNEVPQHRIAEMAAAYLEKRKASVFDAGGAKPSELGLEVAARISALEYPTIHEKDMADVIWPYLETFAEERWMDAAREVSIGPECRVDAMLDNIAIEYKVGGDRSQVYRQLERYSKCRDVDEIVLVCPWPIASFGIDGVYVHVVTYNGKQLM